MRRARSGDLAVPRSKSPLGPLQAALDFAWRPPSRETEGFHGADVLLFGALLQMKAFDVFAAMQNNHFDGFLDTFASKLTHSMLWSSIPAPERVFPVFGLSLLLQKPPMIPLDQRRVRRFVDVLHQLLEQEFPAFAAHHLAAFDAAASQLFQDSCDPDSAYETFVHLFQAFRQEAKIPPIMKKVFLKGMMEAVDVSLVNRIYMQSTKCDFMASIIWNTFSGRARTFAKGPISFDRFTEAVAVIQNTGAIDGDPNRVTDMCPHLPMSAILALLSVRELDEDLTRKPDVVKFASVHGLELYSDFKPVKVDTKALFTADDVVDTRGWVQTPLPQEVFARCPFLRDILA
jgi:hypothetical protein